MNDFENQIEKEAGNNFPDVKDLANLYIELQKVSDEVQQLQNKNIAEEEFIKKVKKEQELKKKIENKENKLGGKNSKLVKLAKSLAVSSLLKQGITPSLPQLKDSFNDFILNNKNNSASKNNKAKNKISKNNNSDLYSALFKKVEASKQAKSNQLNDKAKTKEQPLVRTKF